MIHNNNVDHFSLATNRDDVGAFDDICFKAKIKGFEKPVNVFIQAKHRENDKLLTFTSKTDLAKYFDSYLQIRRSFEPTSKDMIFGGKFDETECFFIMYTTAKDDPNNKIYESSFADVFNELMGTGGCCTQPSYTDESLDFLCKIVMKEQITTLAEQLAKFICDDSDTEMSMNNDLILRYHFIIAHNVLHLSEIQPEGHRIASFRQDFFTTNEEFLVLFKNILCLEVLKKRKSEETDPQTLLLKFLSEPSEVTTLSKLIGSVLIYKNSKLEIVGKSMTDDLNRQLDKANVSQSTVYEAAELAAKEHLLSLKLKVSAFFGNKDLAIRGKPEKIAKRINHLTLKLIEIFKKSNPNNIVTIDESLGDGFLQLNGGIASAVGNILVFDESLKLLKFTDNCELLGNLAKTWYESLKSKIENLHEYKFDVKVKKFPKLSFERGEYDVSLVRDFYDKLLFYTNQADQNGVEKILRGEIGDHPCSDVSNFRVRSDVIFLKYHDEIQKLWMTPKVGSYLTKKSKIFENAVTNAMSEPLMSVLNIMHKIKYKDYTFNENALKPFDLHGQIIGTVIATWSCELTVAKVQQFLENKDRIVLDLENIFKLPLKNHNTLCKELTNTTKEKILIIVYKNFQDSINSGKRLENIVKAVHGKQIIIITNKTSVKVMTEYFPQTSNVLNDERRVFTDLSVESQKNFLATSKINFQGEELSLDIILDDESAKHIVEDVFEKMINNITIEIGRTAFYKNYEKFYVDRRVSRTIQQENNKFDDVKDKVLETLYDLEDEVVLIAAADVGMGMRTLLTHLALKTKQLDSKVWILRIYISRYDRIFSKWRQNKTVINTLESLLLLYKAEICEGELYKEEEMIIELAESSNGTVSVTKCSGDSSTIFKLKIFLDFYNRGRLIFLFEGFDLLFLYGNEALSMMKSIKNYTRKHKTWILYGRTFHPINTILEQEFGPPYKLEKFSSLEQDTYFNRFWKYNIQFKNLNSEQIQNVHDFAHYMLGLLPKNYMQYSVDRYIKYYVKFLKYLQMEAIATGIDFPNDEYNNFMMKIDLYESKVSCMPDDKTPRQVYLIAEYFYNKIKHVNEGDNKNWRMHNPIIFY